jgi:deferrochelatase/peroxidase EfeB
MVPLSDADFSDMQGLLRFGYGKLTGACYLQLRIDDAASARHWLANAPVSSAQIQTPPPSRTLQIALSAQGLSRLGLPATLLQGFSAEFLSGMVGDDNRSRRLGDVGPNAPERWQWGGPSSVPDVVAMIYATPELFDEWKNTLQSSLLQSGFSLIACLPTSDMEGIEPFGFVDGVSSPTIDWERRRDPSGDKLSYENLVMVGEFVLGYPNEYGKYTTRPLVADASADLPDAEDSPNMKDLGRNGSYLVIRQIDQDVRGFWRYLDQEAKSDAQQLAESMVGRKMSGDPLLPLTSHAICGIASDDQRNRFTFDSDLDGTACSFGAHIRRANPRNADLPPRTSSEPIGRLLRILALDRYFNKSSFPRNDLIASTRFHRLIRRGREYGPKLTPEQRLQPAPPGEAPTGLVFICINANIGRQFEFIQSSWIMNTKFNGLSEESDPLLGNREPVSGCPADKFTIPSANGLRRQLTCLPRFTTMRGGAYFFLPGLRALRYLARIASA